MVGSRDMFIYFSTSQSILQWNWHRPKPQKNHPPLRNSQRPIEQKKATMPCPVQEGLRYWWYLVAYWIILFSTPLESAQKPLYHSLYQAMYDVLVRLLWCWRIKNRPWRSRSVSTLAATPKKQAGRRRRPPPVTSANYPARITFSSEWRRSGTSFCGISRMTLENAGNLSRDLQSTNCGII